MYAGTETPAEAHKQRKEEPPILPKSEDGEGCGGGEEPPTRPG